MSQSVDKDANLLKTTSDKVVLIGDEGVGKTSIFLRFKDGKNASISAGSKHNPKNDNCTKSWPVARGQQLTVTLWDTAGIERHMSTIPPTYFRSAKCVILVYSINNGESFESLANWYDNTESAMGALNQNLVKVVVGNKLDLAEDEREVPLERAKKFAKNVDIDDENVVEISALDYTGVEELFELVGRKISPLVKKSATSETVPKQKSKCCSQT